MDFKNQYGYMPEMEGMVKIWDRKKHLVTGIRAYYKTKKTGSCWYCSKPTNKVLDFLGSLAFSCSCHNGFSSEDSKYKVVLSRGESYVQQN